MSLSENRTIMSVSQLNRATGQLLGEHFFNVLVAGELSNTTQASSGHFYFTLKDTNAQVRCALFKTQQRRLTFKPENGKQVIVKAQVSLYEPRGDYQLIIESMELAGDGALQRAFDSLKHKLAQEGLFDAIHKKPIPKLPHCIAVITSPTGAAIHDILTVLKRRFAAIPIIIYPVAVQGTNASFEIAAAIERANDLKHCEVIILGRGGGSLEDLWAFNEERVARAIFNSDIPIISAVGHETDVTIADFVADYRAPTPSAAAEHASPDQQEWLARFRHLEARLEQQWQRHLKHKHQSLLWLTQRLQQQHPGQKLARNAQRVDELDARLNLAMQARLSSHHKHIKITMAQLWQYNPAVTINNYQDKQQYLTARLATAITRKIERLQDRLLNNSQTLHAVSPLATLSRGYGLSMHAKSKSIIRSTEQLGLGDLVETHLASGCFTSKVTKLDEATLLSPELRNK
ncbi:MAG: exodeoxyribonuclease VII large subunit [Methylococcales bacterium]|nr:MAG: exodeoxyribonuclease VII large subunit [Methylococcales bacterium]